MSNLSHMLIGRFFGSGGGGPCPEVENICVTAESAITELIDTITGVDILTRNVGTLILENDVDVFVQGHENGDTIITEQTS